MNLFRIHIRPDGGQLDPKVTFDYCLKEGVLGVGWRTHSNRNTKVWDEYVEEAATIHGAVSICAYICDAVNVGDLVWTRDTLGNYYLARVTSGWEYFSTADSIQRDIDIANVFRCEMKQLNIDDVPGKVIACFRPSRSIQKIADERALEYSCYLWNTLTGQNIYQIDRAKYSDIFMMLDDQETEDLLFLYLQSKDWFVIPHSRKRDTMSFEYICVDPKTGQVAGIQVKTGNTGLNRDDYTQFTHKVFLFQANNHYFGTGTSNVETISPSEVIDFMKRSILWLPATFKRKMEIVNLTP